VGHESLWAVCIGEEGLSGWGQRRGRVEAGRRGVVMGEGAAVHQAAAVAGASAGAHSQRTTFGSVCACCDLPSTRGRSLP
jgi:hypothetical protein